MGYLLYLYGTGHETRANFACWPAGWESERETDRDEKGEQGKLDQRGKGQSTDDPQESRNKINEEKNWLTPQLCSEFSCLSFA